MPHWGMRLGRLFRCCAPPAMHLRAWQQPRFLWPCPPRNPGLDHLQARPLTGSLQEDTKFTRAAMLEKIFDYRLSFHLTPRKKEKRIQHHAKLNSRPTRPVSKQIASRHNRAYGTKTMIESDSVPMPLGNLALSTLQQPALAPAARHAQRCLTVLPTWVR